VFAASEGMVITLGSPGERVEAHMPGSRTAFAPGSTLPSACLRGDGWRARV